MKLVDSKTKPTGFDVLGMAATGEKNFKTHVMEPLMRKLDRLDAEQLQEVFELAQEYQKRTEGTTSFLLLAIASVAKTLLITTHAKKPGLN